MRPSTLRMFARRLIEEAACEADPERARYALDIAKKLLDDADAADGKGVRPMVFMANGVNRR